MEKISRNIATKTDDLFNYPAIYINKTYRLDGNKTDLNDRLSYTKKYHFYYDSIETFYNICALGKRLIKNLKIQNIDDISIQYIKYKKSTNNILKKWLTLNPFPYSTFNIEQPMIRFMYDCIICYIIYDIHKWLIKLKREKDTLPNNVKDSWQFKKMYKSLNYINFDSIELDNRLIYLPSDREYITDKESENYYYNIIHNNRMDLKDVDEYCIFIRQNLLKYIYSIMDNRKTEMLTFKYIPFYEEQTRQHRILESANSIIGIAYNRLLLNLTATSHNMREICHNPDCNNEFETDKRNKLYCGTNRCKREKEHRNHKNSKS